jgi:outer membrane protein assembly factor BamB
VAAVLAASASSAAFAADVDLAKLDEITKRFPFAIELGAPGAKDHRFIYADYRTHIHVYREKDGALDLDWESTNLGSRVTSMFVADLYADGKDKLVVSTAAGRILIYDLDDYDLVWENLQDRFERVQYMVAGNLDADAQGELVFIANGVLYIYDSLNKNIEWQSQTTFDARQILIANVDDDEQMEIILNTGVILDSRFYTIELQADSAFGDRISLFDLNGDGTPEIIGEYGDFNLKVFDIYAEREIW